MNKGLIAFILVAVLGVGSLVIIFMKRSVVESRDAQHKIVEGFKTINERLEKSRDSMNGASKKLFDSIAAKAK